MYGFRKPFSATTFDGEKAFGISLKSALVVAQVFGYMTAKFIGIKFISEVNKAKRAIYILVLIAAAELSLLLLGLVPKPFNVFFLFTNGLSLGLICGLVFSFIEGRKFTDLLDNNNNKLQSLCLFVVNVHIHFIPLRYLKTMISVYR